MYYMFLIGEILFNQFYKSIFFYLNKPPERGTIKFRHLFELKTYYIKDTDSKCITQYAIERIFIFC